MYPSGIFELSAFKLAPLASLIPGVTSLSVKPLSLPAVVISPLEERESSVIAVVAGADLSAANFADLSATNFTDLSAEGLATLEAVKALASAVSLVAVCS